MPIKRSFYSRIAVILYFLTLSRESHGFDVLIGGGGTYSQLQIVNASSAGDSYFRGFSYQLNPRFRFYPLSEKSIKNYGLDVFGIYKRYYLNNITDGANESNSATAYGVGVEVFFSRFFLGVHYLSVLSQVASNGMATQLNYNAIGPSAGVNIIASSRISFQIGTSAFFGTTTGPSGSSSSRSLIELSALAMVHFKLFQLFK